MQLHPDNNVRVRDEISNFLKGPIYLLVLKVPLFLIGVILYIIYRIVKFTIKQLIKLFTTILIHIAYLVENTIYYLILILKRSSVYVQYFSVKFYINIFQPIKFFMFNFIFPIMYNVNKLILDTVSWFCVWSYQQIIRPLVLFCYLNVILPNYTWMKELFITFYNIFSLVFHRFCSLCIWIYQNILYPLWIFILTNILVLCYQNALRIGSLVHTILLIPLNRLIKYILPIIFFYLQTLFLDVSTCVMCTIGSFCDVCTFVYGYILLPFCQTIFKISLFIYRELLKPVMKLILYMARIICDKLYQFIFYPIGCVLYSIEQFCYKYFSQLLSGIVYILIPAAMKIFSEILIMIYSGLNATALVIGTLSKAIASIFRTTTNT